MARFQASAGANNRQAHLANAYQELGNELCSTALKVVGGYTLGRVIGEGTFGSVHLATHRLTGTRCAVKKIPKNLTSQVTREIHHHRRLHHLHIVQLYEVIATESHVWLVTELCSGGELFDYLVEKGRMLEGEARRLFGELAVAVGYMHREGVVHRDLKLENVLLDGELRVKLGDLGFAREWHKGKLMETHCGTTGYASPEMLSGQKYLGVETDLWSLGVILYILLCGGLPFDDDDERVMRELILKGVYDEPEWLSDPAKNLVQQLLQPDPAARLSIEGILSHPWFSMTITDHPPPSPMPDAESRRGSRGNLTPDEMRRVHSGEFSQTEQVLESLHHERTVSFDDAALQLPISSRTPSRTKRRSVSSTMSLERRASTSGTLFSPVDYLSQLRAERTAPFSTPAEKRLLGQLQDLGIDTGQLVHSVETDACDSSSASWWILRAKQLERETGWDWRRVSTVKEDVSPGEMPTSKSMPSMPLPVVQETPSTPTREVEGSPRDKAKTRSPSMSMLQRATSAFLGKTEEREAPPSPKRDSLWTWNSFRQFFGDTQKKKREDKPTLVLSRGIAARAPHAGRIVNTAASRRTSVDRPALYSRRSSSVNSSIHERSDGLYRRSSQRSHGSQTPTSDVDHPSRPDSTHGSRRNSRAPPSPLHNYQRRPPQGTASTRIRHIRVIPESQMLRSNSVASSIRSSSSRASSVHEDDDSVHSVRRRRDESLARQIHRKGSPLNQPRARRKKVRDVFEKEDEWVDEDRFAGGLGQAQGQVWFNGQRANLGKTAAVVKKEEPSRRGVPASRPGIIEEEEEEE